MIAPWMIKIVGPLTCAVNAGKKRLTEMHEAGETPDKTHLGAYMLLSLSTIDPQVKGRSILDDENKVDLANGIAGILINILDAEAGK